MSGFRAEETALLDQVNAHLTENQQQRWRQLEEKRRAELLTEDDHQELIQLNDLLEQLVSERLAALIKLAEFRQQVLPDLMAELGIEPNKW